MGLVMVASPFFLVFAWSSTVYNPYEAPKSIQRLQPQRKRRIEPADLPVLVYFGTLAITALSLFVFTIVEWAKTFYF